MKKTLLLLVLMIAFVSCSKPTIKGKVFDSYGNPIEGVNIEIEGTSFKSITNNLGEYSTDFVPGSIQLNFTKDGFTNRNLSIDIAEKTEYPAKEIIMMEVPSKKGLYFIDNEKRKNIELLDFKSNTQTSVIRTYRSSGWGGGTQKNVYQSNYIVKTDNSNIPKIKGQEIKIIDNLYSRFTLVKARKLSENEFKIITTEGYDDDNINTRANNYTLKQTVIKQRTNKKEKPNFNIIELNLGKGFYAFYKPHTNGDAIKSKQVKIFEVE